MPLGDRCTDEDRVRDDRFRRMTNTSMIRLLKMTNRMKLKKGFIYGKDNVGGSRVGPQD